MAERRKAHHLEQAGGLGALSLALLTAFLSAPAFAKDRFDQSLEGIAIRGYDTVAYFTEGKAVKGQEAFAYDWLGATWHFASAAHRDLFMAEPIRYAPQYGGYCTSGIVAANIHSADPKIWRIIEGKLYLNGSDYALKSWAKGGADVISKTDSEWLKLEAKLTQ